MNIRGREGGREVNIDIEIINERGEGEGNHNEILIQNQINKGAMENKNNNITANRGGGQIHQNIDQNPTNEGAGRSIENNNNMDVAAQPGQQNLGEGGGGGGQRGRRHQYRRRRRNPNQRGE